jgi:hypothetical protein
MSLFFIFTEKSFSIFSKSSENGFICHKRFANRHSKSHHITKGRCKSLIDDNQVSILNNNNVNTFGNEDLSYLLEDGKLLQKLKEYGKKGIYGLADIVKEIHCNKEQPQNNTIVKPLDYGDGVYIMGDEKEWEYREFEDIRDTMIETVSNYFGKYNEMKDKLGVKLTDRRERWIIKGLCYSLLGMNGDIPDDLFEELEIDDAKVEEEENKIKTMLRKFDKATMTKLHEYTSSNYKKEQGKYVKSE